MEYHKVEVAMLMTPNHKSPDDVDAASEMIGRLAEQSSTAHVHTEQKKL